MSVIMERLELGKYVVSEPIPNFATIRERMGKVVRVSPEGIRYYERNVPGEQRMSWPVL